MQDSVFPARARVLSGSAIKAIAIFAMLVDHTAICFSPLLRSQLFTAFNIVFTPYVLLRGFGRIAFPAFCFLLAEGFRYTGSRQRYALNLFLFALLSELPYDLFNREAQNFTELMAHQNVFFTLLLGFLGIWAMDRFSIKPGLSSLALVGLAVCSHYLHADYGWKGFLLILLTYLAAEQPVLQLFSGIVLLSWPAGVALAYPILNLYSGQRGFVRSPWLKYAFYLFYPVHLTILWLICRHFFGG